MSLRSVSFIAAAALVLNAGAALAVPVDLAVNGGFESGDFTGWSLFNNSAASPINIFTPGYLSNFCADLNNNTEANPLVIKNNNIGIGTVVPGETITISFDAKGSFGVGGVAFAEFFSELAGGGTSKAVILGGGPLAVNANTWTHFSFTTTAGPNVDGGVTLQLSATTGAIQGSTAHMFYDNAIVTVDRVPTPSRRTSWSRIKQLYR